MANYKDIHGTNIETVASDPSNPVNGQVWYNSTDQKLKGFTENPAGAWASGGNVNTARYVSGGTGTQTAALMIAGATAPPNNKRAYVESYNGSSWTEIADLNTARFMTASAGGPAGQTAALAIAGGADPGNLAVVESWNGSSWTEVGDLNTARQQAGGAGTSTAAITFGGYATFTEPEATTESWNGSSWTEVGDLNTERLYGAPAGTATSALYAGGDDGATPTVLAVAESWNGSAWTEVGDLNEGRSLVAGGGTSNTAALAFGGYPGSGRTAKTESYNGSSWTEVADLSAARGRQSNGPIGTQGSSLSVSGHPPSFPLTQATEEFTAPLEATREFDAS
jgi:hypothetical protein|tara:strand:+ start:3607 stop:4620 length:1014 start_codon:yes stop_codon:yes gene_type:complete